MNLDFWSFFLLGLLAVALLTAGLISLWLQRGTAQDRLQSMNGDVRTGASRSDRTRHWLSTSPQVEHWLDRLPGVREYDRFVQQTGWPLTVAQVLMASLTLVVLSTLAALLLGADTGLTLVLALLMALTLQAVLAVQRYRRNRLLEQQLPDALELIARSMQAGHAFTSALQMAARETPAPMGSDLTGVFNAIQYGASVQDALAQWAQGVAGDDVHIFVTGVRIQSETGGNLAELMQQSAALIRERQKLRGSIRVLSAEGRISALILTLLPFVLAALMTALNPQFMDRLWQDPLGQRLVSGALLLMLLGIVWMWRLVQIRP